MDMFFGYLWLPMFELLIIAVAVLALLTARRQSSRISGLERLVIDLSRKVDTFSAGRPLPPPTSPTSTPNADVAKPATAAPPSAPSVPTSSHPLASPPSGSVPLTLPPTLPAASSPPTQSLEERLGTRWAVWLGGLALGLGGLLMVRYSIEQGYFGPTARVTMGLMFAAALAAAGEWFRRGERDLGLTAIPAAHIPGILTAAGSLTAFGAIFAGHALYDLIGPATAFVLLGAIGLATVFAAALHGPVLGALGLVGAYAAPLLVSSQKPSPWPVVLYLAVIAAATMGLARLRRWLWLAGLAVGGAVLWGLPYLFKISSSVDWQLAGYVHVIVQLALAAYFLAVSPNAETADADARPEPVAGLALGAFALLTCVFLAAGRFDLATSIPFAVLAAAVLMAAAWFSAPAVAGCLLAGLVLLAAVVTWPGVRVPSTSYGIFDEFSYLIRAPDTIGSYLSFAALATLALTGAATLRLWTGYALRPVTAGLYALAATLPPLLALIVVYLRVTQFDASLSFASAAALLAVTFACLASIFERRDGHREPGQRLATGAFAVAAIGGFCLALVMVLARGYLTVALALTALGTAMITTRSNIPLLRHVVSALALVVLARLAWNPRIMGADVGSWPIVNWLLVGYGIPAAAFWASARQLEAHGSQTSGAEVSSATQSSQFADAVAVLLAGLLSFFQIRHLTNGGDILAVSSNHMEMGLMAFVSLGMSYALMRLDLGRANTVFRLASIIFGVGAAATALIGLGIVQNPLLTRETIFGPAVFSSLLLAYAAPGLMAAVVARGARTKRPPAYVTVMAVVSLVLLFAYVTLEVRHVFQGATIGIDQPTSSAEQWTYSFAWLVVGVLMLAYGIFRQSFVARIASAASVLLAVLKVFLFDLSRLSGIWRPLSFIVLGLVLIGIGLAYQNLLFGRRGKGEAPPA